MSDAPPKMMLVWEKDKDGQRMHKVCLREDTIDTTSSPTSSVRQEQEDDPVLKMERQVRKAQHARKAGAIVTDKDLDVIYCDEHIVVVNKPPGVLTVPGLHSRSSLLDLVVQRFVASSTTIDKNDSLPQSDQLIVHRLDMDTSGLVIFGRSAEATRLLHEQFRTRAVHKEYECIVTGHILPSAVANEQGAVCSGLSAAQTETFVIDLPLQRDHEHPPFRRVSCPASEQAAIALLEELHRRGLRKKWKRKNPQSSQSRVRVLDRGGSAERPWTRLRLEPITGRTHQLRVHCAALGFPIVGDPTYGLYGEAAPLGGLADVRRVVDHGLVGGVKQLNREVATCPLTVQDAWMKYHRPNEAQMCLHAALLELNHPLTGERMKWEVQPDF